MKTETRVGIFVLVALGIFFYMSFHLEVFRLDWAKYRPYVVYFDDVTGLDKKADVKIAGVKVGWIEKIELLPNDESQAKVYIRILKRYTLRSDAFATVRQDGLLGTKYLEIMPGDPIMPPIEPGKPLAKPGRPPASMDEILHKAHEIAINVEDVTDSFQATFGGQKGKQELQETVDNFKDAAARFASFSGVLDRTLSNNEDSLNSLITDLKDVARDMKEVVPSFRSSIERISDVFDRDFNRMATEFEKASGSLCKASDQAGGIVEKINAGKGVIGTLINDEDMANDVSYAVRSLKDYFNHVNALSIVFDSHGEFMYRPAENFPIEDSKGYFDIRIHPNDDYFYIVQLVSSIRGKLKRRITEIERFNEHGDPVSSGPIPGQDVNIPNFSGTIITTKRKLDQTLYGLQVGKIFKHVALRFGLIEGYAGFGVDFEVPFTTDKFRWVTSIEAFDFRGRARIRDSRPHFKWINRMFLLRNIYMAFGADDFVSRKNANGFFGMGIRFCDDDIKYVASRIGLGSFGG